MIDFLKEFWEFLRERKKYWLLPVIIVLALFGILIVLSQGSVVAPFIYTIFQVTSILGISAFYHDSAAALIIDGKIIAAAQEERFSRKKHDERFPKNAINYVLQEGRLNLNDIDYCMYMIRFNFPLIHSDF